MFTVTSSIDNKKGDYSTKLVLTGAINTIQKIESKPKAYIEKEPAKPVCKTATSLLFEIY